MANLLETIVDQRRLRFGDNLRVQEIDANDAVVKETDWTSESGDSENEFTFRFDDETHSSLAVKYAFNARNQLTVQIVKQPGVAAASEVWTLPGKITANDDTDIEYFLLDENGVVSTRKIEIYAKLEFSNDNLTLNVELPDGTTTSVAGATKNALKASSYSAGGDIASDLLAFTAFTRNGASVTPAAIAFHGRWDMHENGLVFVTKYENTPGGKPSAYIALAGKIKGTNVGLVVGDGAAALQVNGRYNWNQNTLGWDLNVGYSKAAGIEARLAGDAKIVTAAGNVLTMSGNATLKKGKQGVALDLDLKINYETKSGHLVFTLTGGTQGSYQVQLSGDFKIRGGNVTFTITASTKDGEVTGKIEFGFYTQDKSLKGALEAVLTPNGISLKLELEFILSWGPSGPVAKT